MLIAISQQPITNAQYQIPKFMKINEEHFYFSSNNHELYGMFYEPMRITQDSENFIILHPLAEEKKSSQKFLVDLARRLCENGNYVLLFDYYGCGDSEGELKDAGLSIWLKDIKQASLFLREKTKINDVNIIGLRLGAFLGCVYANTDIEINKLILLEPVFNPAKDLSRSLRSKLMKELCTDGEITSNRNDLLTNLSNDISVDFSGHEISSKFYKDLLNYKDIVLYKSLTTRENATLLVNITQMGKPTRQYQKLLSDIGVGSKIQNKLIKLEPFWGQIDLPDCSELIEEVISSCDINGDRRPETVIQEEVNSEQLTVNSEDGNKYSVLGNQFSDPQCPIPNAYMPKNTLCSILNPGYKESVLTVQNEKYKILGVITEPKKDNIKGITIVFLHGWAGYRIGPHRMIVDYARKLAGLGFHCVRFDFRGKGFSQLDEEPNNKTQLSDLECILNKLHELELSDKIILAGICSGARLALYYAMKGERAIDGVIELSTPLLRPENQAQVELTRSKSLLGDYYKKAFRKETWLKLFNNELKFRLIFRIILKPVINSIQFLFRKNALAKKSIPTKQNEAFVNFKGEILAIHGEKDPETEVALKQVINLTCKYGIPFEKHIIKGANHSFYSIDWKNEIFEIIQGWLGKRYS
jgi:pimeloyl-ACP methyl ester carboxylesterase